MNLKKILFLAALLGFLLLYVTRVEMEGDKAKLAEEQPFQSLAPSSIESIEVTSTAGTVALKNNSPSKKVDGATDLSITEEQIKNWEVKGVPGSELDRGALNGFTSALRSLKLEGGISKEDVGTDLAPFGLASPESTIKVKADGTEHELRFGKQNEYVSKRYLQVTGKDGLYLVNSELMTAANKPQGDFRKRTPVELVDGDISTISITDQKSTVKLGQNDKNEWRIMVPRELPANSYSVANVTREIRNLRATDFVDGKDNEAASFGFDKPSLIVNVDFKETSKRAPLEVKVAKKDDAFYFAITGKPSFFKLASDPAGRLMRPINELREKKLFKFDTAKVKEIQLSNPQGEGFTIKKDGSQWKVDDKEGDQPFVDQVVNAISELEAATFPEDENGKYGFDKPGLKIAVKLAGEGENVVEKTLMIGNRIPSPDNKPGENKFYAIVEGTGLPFIITEDSLKRINSHKEALLKSDPTPAPTAASVPSP